MLDYLLDFVCSHHLFCINIRDIITVIIIICITIASGANHIGRMQEFRVKHENKLNDAIFRHSSREIYCKRGTLLFPRHNFVAS